MHSLCQVEVAIRDNAQRLYTSKLKIISRGLSSYLFAYITGINLIMCYNVDAIMRIIHFFLFFLITIVDFIFIISLAS